VGSPHNAQKKLLLFIGIIYFIRVMLFGSRIAGIQILCLIFILYYENKFKNIFIYFFSIIGFLIMSLMENLRYGKLIVLNIQNINQTFISNQTDVFYSSTVYLALIKNGIYDINFRIKSFIGFIINIILPSKYTFPEGIISEYSKSYDQYGGGGFIGVYFYVWLSYIGVVLIGILIAKIFNKMYKTKNKNIILFSIISLTTFPRWYAYSPITFIKMGFLAIIGYNLIKLLDSTILKIKNIYKRTVYENSTN